MMIPFKTLTRLSLALAIGASVSLTALSVQAAPAWKPQSSERLVKLPPRYLEKSIDHDFATSALGSAMQ